MNTLVVGHRAEQVAAEYLKHQGFDILERNWRTRYCEIDIVCRRGRTIWFVEVKYRRRKVQGRGLDYVTPQKLRQMRFAAEIWVHRYHWSQDIELLAVEVSGPGYVITAVARC